MKIQCDKCKTVYTINEDKVPDTGTKVQCLKCRCIIRVIKHELETHKVAPIKEIGTNNKKCPYCAEKIAISAIKCRYCGEWLNQNIRKDEKYQDAIEEFSPTEFIYDQEPVETKSPLSTKKIQVVIQVIFVVLVFASFIIISATGRGCTRKLYNKYTQYSMTDAEVIKIANQRFSKEEKDKVFFEIVAKLKQELHLPYRYNSDSTCVDIVYNPELRAIIYLIQFPQWTKAECLGTKGFYQMTENEILTRVRESEKKGETFAKLMLVDMGLNVVYAYYDKFGKYIFEIKVSAADL